MAIVKVRLPLGRGKLGQRERNRFRCSSIRSADLPRNQWICTGPINSDCAEVLPVDQITNTARIILFSDRRNFRQSAGSEVVNRIPGLGFLLAGYLSIVTIPADKKNPFHAKFPNQLEDPTLTFWKVGPLLKAVFLRNELNA